MDVGVVHFELQHFSSLGHSESPLHDCCDPWVPLLLGQFPGLTSEKSNWLFSLYKKA